MKHTSPLLEALLFEKGLGNVDPETVPETYPYPYLSI